MDADRWFYIDVAGTQFGPATAADIREALRLGRATESCLAWREGMATWQPIQALSRELGLATTAPPPFAAPPAADTDPYRAPQSAEMQAVDRDDVAYAGFIRRFAAAFLDSLLLGVASSLVALPFLGSPPFLPNTDPATVFRAALAAQLPQWGIGLVLSMLYYTLQESSSAQATLGKRALGIKVADLDGNRLSWPRALGRWAGKLLSYLTLYIGFVMAAFTARKQGLHDLVAGTVVVDQWAYTSEPGRQRRQPQGCAVALLVVVLLVFGLGIAAMAFAFAAFSRGGYGF